MILKMLTKQTERFKIGIIALLSTGVCSLLYFFHGVLGIDKVVTHFFYVPVILAAFWWRRKGLVVAVLLSAILIFSHIFFAPDGTLAANFIRSFMFIVAGFVVAVVNEHIIKQQEDLQNSEEKYRTLTENSLTGIFIHQDGKFVFVNNRFAEIHGYIPEELLGMEYLLLVHPDERQLVKQRVSGRLEGKAVPKEYQVWRLKKDGKAIWCRMMATQIKYRGRPAVMGNVIDITELKRAEEKIRNTLTELQETQDMLVQSETLAAIGRLTTGVAHEVLNPVNIISMKLQLLQVTECLSPEVKTEIDDCKLQLQRITNITKNISHFSRISEKHMYFHDLNNIIKNVLNLCAPQFKVENIDTDILYQPDLPMMLLDRERIEQVILNIISNALAAMKNQERKIIKITTKTEPSGKSPKYTRLIISDTGSGIKKEHLYRLFDPFFTTKKFGEGTGMGLFISYNIIKEHGGKLWAENNKSGGASFTIELPIIKEHDNKFIEERRTD